MGFLDDLKKEFLNEENKKKLGTFSRSTKSELSKLPIISIIGDSTQGASGLGYVQNLIKKDPDNPKNWLFYYEAHIFHKTLKGGVSVARGILNPVGFVVGKGISTGLNAIDDEYQKFDPKVCLLMIQSIVSKSIKKNKVTSEEIAIYAKSQYYLAVNILEENNEEILKQAVKNMSLAIEIEKLQSVRAEFFFYLAQIYKAASRMKLYYRALNISRKLGFLPAHSELVSFIKNKELSQKDRTNKLQELNKMERLKNNCPYREFKYTYKADFGERAENTLDYVFKEQSKKFSETKKRLGNFLSKL